MIWQYDCPWRNHRSVPAPIARRAMRRYVRSTIPSRANWDGRSLPLRAVLGEVRLDLYSMNRVVETQFDPGQPVGGSPVRRLFSQSLIRLRCRLREGLDASYSNYTCIVNLILRSKIPFQPRRGLKFQSPWMFTFQP